MIETGTFHLSKSSHDWRPTIRGLSSCATRGVEKADLIPINLGPENDKPFRSVRRERPKYHVQRRNINALHVPQLVHEGERMWVPREGKDELLRSFRWGGGYSGVTPGDQGGGDVPRTCNQV